MIIMYFALIRTQFSALRIQFYLGSTLTCVICSRCSHNFYKYSHKTMRDCLLQCWKTQTDDKQPALPPPFFHCIPSGYFNTPTRKNGKGPFQLKPSDRVTDLEVEHFIMKQQKSYFFFKLQVQI